MNTSVHRFALAGFLVVACLVSGCYTSFSAADYPSPGNNPSAAASDSVDSQPPIHAYKDPDAAFLYSFLIPGGGHLYAGDTDTGSGLLLAGIGAPLVGYLVTSKSISVSCSGARCEDETNWAPLYIGMAVGTGAWLYGMATAHEAAQEANRRNGFRVQAGVAPLQVEGGVRPGLAIRATW